MSLSISVILQGLKMFSRYNQMSLHQSCYLLAMMIVSSHLTSITTSVSIMGLIWRFINKSDIVLCIHGGWHLGYDENIRLFLNGLVFL